MNNMISLVSALSLQVESLRSIIEALSWVQDESFVRARVEEEIFSIRGFVSFLYDNNK